MDMTNPLTWTPVVIIGSFGPALAAVAVSFASGGAPAVKHLLSRLICWRVNWFWYLTALLIPAIAILIAVAPYGITSFYQVIIGGVCRFLRQWRASEERKDVRSGRRPSCGKVLMFYQPTSTTK
ncbi:MAG: hypothetical protein ACREN8_11115, partial [Candidatus Dormibacteraceae bacterium]